MMIQKGSYPESRVSRGDRRAEKKRRDYDVDKHNKREGYYYRRGGIGDQGILE